MNIVLKRTDFQSMIDFHIHMTDSDIENCFDDYKMSSEY